MLQRVLLFVALVASLGIVAASAEANPPDQLEGPNGEHQVVVCKYVGTPGAGEVLQTGQNPIVVDYHSLSGFTGSFPFEFNDAQGRSIAVQWTDDVHFSDLGVCPPPDTGEPDCSGDFDPDNNGPFGNCDEGVRVCQDGEIVLAPTGTEDDGTCDEEPPPPDLVYVCLDSNHTVVQVPADQADDPQYHPTDPPNDPNGHCSDGNSNPPPDNPNNSPHHSPDAPPILTSGEVPFTE